MQEQTLNILRKQKLLIKIFFKDNFYLEGFLLSFDKDTILLQTENFDKQYLIYKNSILYIEKTK